MSQSIKPISVIAAVLLATLLLAGATSTATATTQVASHSSTSTSSLVDAQQMQQANNTTANYTSKPTLVGDDDLHIVDYWKTDGVLYVQLYSEHSTTVTISTPPGSTAELAGGYIEETTIDRQQLSTVSIPAPGSTASIMSTDSKRNGRFTQIDLSGPSAIPSNFNGTDVLTAGAAASGFTGAAVLVGVYQWRYARDEDGGEQVA